jgi:hypothetical protein
MSDAWSFSPAPKSFANPFVAPQPAIAATQVRVKSDPTRATVAGADVLLNPDGSVTVSNLKDGKGQLHTVYIPVANHLVPGQSMRVFIDGLPLNPISQDHLFLAQRARAIGVDTQLKSELNEIARHDRENLELLANAIRNGRDEEARRYFQRYRHTSNDTNNFYKLARPLRTILMMLLTPKDCLLDAIAAQVQMTYTVNSTGAVLSVYLSRRSVHLWDR